jgi:hypothetical protein
LFDISYEVELTEEAPVIHLADWTLMNIAETDNYESFVEKANAYWRGEPTSNIEVVTTSAVRIVRRLL